MTRFVVALAVLLSACVLDEATEADIEEGEVELESTTSGPTVTELANRETIRISGGANTIKYFKLEVPAGHDYVAVYRSNTSLYVGASIYMKHGSLPTTSSYQCRHLNGTSGPCKINYPVAGTYYIMVLGAGTDGYSNMPLQASASTKYHQIPNNYSAAIWNQYGTDQFYKLSVPDGAGTLTVSFKLDPDDDGKIDLVVKRGLFATETSYDCKKYINWYQWTVEGTCTFTNPTAGTYYIGLLGYGTKVVGTFKAGYRLTTFNDAPTTATMN